MKTLLTIILLTLVSSAWADKLHKPYLTAPITRITQVNETTITKDQAAGVALAIAGNQHHFDFATDDWQASVGLGSYNEEDAASLAMGKRLKGVLLNGSVGRADGEYGYGIGMNWRFK